MRGQDQDFSPGVRSRDDSPESSTDVPRAGRLIFGGSFNPVHRGHLAILNYVLGRDLCGRVLILPAGQSPFKHADGYASGEDRLDMISAALDELPPVIRDRIDVSDLELQRPGPSFTADTLRELEDGIHTGLLMGADSLESFQNWKEADWILNRVSLYVVFRVETGRAAAEASKKRLEGFFPLAKIHLLAFEPPACSSTLLREELARGAGYDRLKDCLPLNVYSLASSRQLYRLGNDHGPAYV